MQLDLLFDLRDKKIWVAGETGMVGQALTRRLKNMMCEVLSAPHAMLDLTDKEATQSWIKENQPDVIIVAAGKVGGIGANLAEPEEFVRINMQIAKNVIHGAFQAEVPKLLYLGSSCIYPKMAEQPIKEEALGTGELEPSNAGYARAKIEGLKLCQYYREEYGCDFISAMPTNLYGPNDKYDAEKSHVIPSMIFKIHQAKINNDEKVMLWGSGTPLREFLYVDDLAEALIHMLEYYSDTLPLNIGSGEEISIYDLAQKIANVIGYEGRLFFNELKPDGTPRKLLDSGRMNALGWKSAISLDQGLPKAYQWFLKHPQAV